MGIDQALNFPKMPQKSSPQVFPISLDALLQEMLNPAVYPHAVTLPIQVIHTHISMVVLTGSVAYKLKKPINFGFLDFSTLDQRQHYCQEEVRLNQRGAPNLYLNVVPITIEKSSLRIEGDGPCVEYAVKMRQFDQAQLFSELIESDRLFPKDLVKLGQVVAEFHRKTQSNAHIASFGSVEQIKAAIDENYQQTQSFIGTSQQPGPQTHQQWLETKAFSDRFFSDHRLWFEQRQAQGKIRECHGDLHLRNICYWQDEIQLFDCIEFNESFLFVDVMYDVAFTVMDLDVRQRSDLATIFLNTYLEQTVDWDGMYVLPLYLSRQAYVRAKVQSLLSVDPQLSQAERAAADRTAAMYYQQAWQYSQPKQGRLFLMSGLSGSGKSTVARSLAPAIAAIHLRSDAMRKHLAGIPLLEKGDADLYASAMTQKTYEQLIEMGTGLASQGYSVILDAKFDRQYWRGQAIAAAQQANLPITILHCTAPLEVLRDRLQQRQGDVSDATANLLSQQQANAEPFTSNELAHVKTIDTTQAIDFSDGIG